jgi:RNA polymerase sigma factor (TIGR02999 family)
MHTVTDILNAVDAGDARAAEKLYSVVYDELRRLAAAKVAREPPGQTLDATALVHEAYLRLAGGGPAPPDFANRRHFFAAAAEAMRRILIDRARARRAAKRGGHGQRSDEELDALAGRYSDAELIDTDSVLDALARDDAEAADLVRLHVFCGLSIEDAGAALGLARATAYRTWDFARAWLRDALRPRQ